MNAPAPSPLLSMERYVVALKHHADRMRIQVWIWRVLTFATLLVALFVGLACEREDEDEPREGWCAAFESALEECEVDRTGPGDAAAIASVLECANDAKAEFDLDTPTSPSGTNDLATALLGAFGLATSQAYDRALDECETD